MIATSHADFPSVLRSERITKLISRIKSRMISYSTITYPMSSLWIWWKSEITKTFVALGFGVQVKNQIPDDFLQYHNVSPEFSVNLVKIGDY